jgi:flagellar motor switch protein FliM
MERVLTQEEINAMVRVASGQQDDGQGAETRTIKPCTFRQSGQLTGEQVAAVNGLHEGFARNLTQSLGAYLRVSFEVIMEGVAKIICRELESAWTPLGTKLDLDGRQPPAQMQRFLAPTEKTLCLSFEVKLAEKTGTLNLIFPVSISNTLLRKLSASSSYGRSRPVIRNGGQLAAKMLDCSFPVELGITAIKLSIHTLAGLLPHNVCNLGIPVLKPASLIIAGREAFEANPARQGRLRAAQLGRPLDFAGEERKH